MAAASTTCRSIWSRRPSCPEELTWFKWESYATWISGFFLLVWVYYLHADLYTIDPAVAALEPWQAAAIGIGALVLGWLVYDGLCKSPLGRQRRGARRRGLRLHPVAAAYGFTHVFNGRAAFLHTGAMIATWMSANVFMVIIPNQKKVVASLLAGRVARPDARQGGQAALDAQQLPDPAGPLPDAVEPLSAGLVVALCGRRSSA